LYAGNHLRYACRGALWRKGVGRALFTGVPYFAVYWAGEIFAGWGYAEVNTAAHFAFEPFRGIYE